MTETTPFVLVGQPDQPPTEFRQFGHLSVPVYHDVLVYEQIRSVEIQRWLEEQTQQGRIITQVEYDVQLTSLFLSLRLGADWTVERVMGLRSRLVRELADFFRSEIDASTADTPSDDSDPKPTTTSEPSTGESTGSSEPNTPESPDSQPDPSEVVPPA